MDMLDQELDSNSQDKTNESNTSDDTPHMHTDDGSVEEVDDQGSVLEASGSSGLITSSVQYPFRAENGAAVTFRVVQVAQSPDSEAAQVLTSAYSGQQGVPVIGSPFTVATTAEVAADGSQTAALAATPTGQFYVMMSSQDVLAGNPRSIAPRRRDKINNWIVKLSKIVPDCTQDHTKQGQSKGGILAKTCDYIQDLRSSNARLSESLKESERMSVEAELLRQQCEELKAENALLRNQLQQHGIVIADLSSTRSSYCSIDDHVCYVSTCVLLQLLLCCVKKLLNSCSQVNKIKELRNGLIDRRKSDEDRQGDVLRWGDEVEYMLVKFDDEKRVALLHLKAIDILQQLQEKEINNVGDMTSLWRPEFASYMVEGTPGKPYGGLMAHFNIVEANMRSRREEVTELLKGQADVLTLTSFPRLGCGIFTDPPTKPTPTEGASHSLFFPDEAIYPGHPRFRTLTRNIRERRGEKVAINIPIYKDEKTENPFVEDFSVLGDDGEAKRAAKPDHVYMDCMGFGMGCCCLQVTFQACNITEARLLYDQLATICPIALALSAASPIHRGYLTDCDSRWNIIAASVDDRTREERGIEPLNHCKYKINKSRYDSIDSYLSPLGEKYNDIDLVYDKEIYQQLIDAGIDHLLARHLAHLFIRDPISLFEEKLKQDDTVDSDHFENIQSTNWQTMRFKPPPPNSEIGWRVEFRPCEVQMTDFENAAFVVFIVLLTRAILSFKVNFLIPISKVDENLATAQKRDSIRNAKFWFRKDIMTCVSPPEAAACVSKCGNVCHDEYSLLTINEIINGKENEFPGLVPLIHSYLNCVDVDADTHCTIQQYLKFIQKRASGELKTTARWMRDFVKSHPDYKNDSKVCESINYDLLKTVSEITQGLRSSPELLGNPGTKSKDMIPTAVCKAEHTYG
ncbi:hypothetical protein CHUAL_008982 [Chamberlinius hualienensis]